MTVKNEKYFKIFSNGSYYVGELSNSLSPHGYGKLNVSASECYEGYFN